MKTPDPRPVVITVAWERPGRLAYTDFPSRMSHGENSGSIFLDYKTLHIFKSSGHKICVFAPLIFQRNKNIGVTLDQGWCGMQYLTFYYPIRQSKVKN